METLRNLWSLITHTLIITGMVEKKIRVCDICGGEAHKRQTMDVCVKHSVSGSTRATPAAKSTKMTTCPECGKKVKVGAGLSIHMGRAHKEPVKK